MNFWNSLSTDDIRNALFIVVIFIALVAVVTSPDSEDEE